MKKIGNWIVLFVLVLLLLAAQAGPSAAFAAGTIRFVIPGGINSGTCGTWATACNLQRALAVVAVSGDQLWVKQGTYKPTGTANRGVSFVLKNGIRIYGGFAGTETLLSQRNPALHITILSGEIATASKNDNSYHVLIGGGTNSTAVLDGFFVKGGNADGAYPDDGGGGIFNNGGSPSLTNITFSGNSAGDSGGGGMLNTASSSPTLSKITFSGNLSTNGGGGMENYNGSSPKLTNVTFSGNSATNGGGGMITEAGSPTLTDVTFSGNSAAYSGGGMDLYSSNTLLTNVTFHGNSAPLGAGMFIGVGSPMLTNVTFSGNSATQGRGIFMNAAGSVIINDSILWDGASEIYNGSASTATIKDSILQGGALGSCYSGVTCTHVLASNPLLSPLANNGGYTKTMALGAGSPAIEAGNNSTCAPTDQRGIHRPQGLNCDMGAYEAPLTKTFRSIGAQDGWILESGENTNVGGGSPNSTGPTLTLGDDTNRRQYRTILSFNTASLPNNASIVSIKLQLKRSSVTPPATHPISIFQGIMLDLKKGFFGSNSALQVGDFQAMANKTVGPYSPTLFTGFYLINLPSTAFTSINKLGTNGGLTQIRLRFKLDDNNNGIANTLNLISGNNTTVTNRPTLIIEYNMP